MLIKEEEILKGLTVRSDKLVDLVNMLGGSGDAFNFSKVNDFTKFREAVQDLSETLVTAARNEVELGAKHREAERLSLEKKQAIRIQ